jgi:hypothetical protein
MQKNGSGFNRCYADLFPFFLNFEHAFFSLPSTFRTENMLHTP